jgi:ribosomal protein S18 acetylase RimI-like enzyme
VVRTTAAFQLTVRTGTPRDAVPVVEIWNQAFGGPGRWAERYSLLDYEALFGVAKILVAEAGAIQGSLALVDPGLAPSSLARSDELEITRLAVAKPARQRGIGRLLLECAETEARQHGARRLVLWTRPSQTPAHQLYRSLGYAREPARDQVPNHRVYVLSLHRYGLARSQP